MASSGSSVPPDLNRLTVPQLKALCKERRITGFSKLSKAALLQRLVATANDQASRSVAAVSATTPANEVRNSSAYVEPSTACRDANVTKVLHQPGQPATASNVDSESTSSSTTKASLPIKPSKVLQIRATSTTFTSTQKRSSTKRPAHIDISGTPKRSRTSLRPATTAGHEPPISRATTPQQELPDNSLVFKVPEVPAQRKLSVHDSASTLAKQFSGISKSSAVPRRITTSLGRFKPLVVLKAGPAEPGRVDKEPARASATSATPGDSALFPNFHTKPLPLFAQISFPPRVSERKWVHRWAIILSAISPTDRRTCMFVSRTLRYAVYLSAIHVLSRNYAGRRLDAVLEQYPKNMTNFWPYLQHREDEVSERRRAFKRSFLGRYTDSVGYDPLSKHLWTGPDDEKQVDVAIRFVLTRMWFAVSVGAYGHDASTWSRCVVQDVQEVVKGEIWQVIAQDDRVRESCSFYVLEATCEVIGQPSASNMGNTLGYCLRTDWTAWISQQSRRPRDAEPSSLLEHVKWSNAEEYHLGVSKAWLHRVQGQDVDSIAKRSVAGRYILASVVANGISGQWMSTSAMAQEFAGLPDNAVLGSRAAQRSSVDTVNMYLPAHHHIESVHFTTAEGGALHGAVAVVQTPGREYYVLRDNGMQVGCEEEGIPDVWQRILGCDVLGRAR